MERWIDVLSLVLKLFTLYTAVTGLFFLLPQKSYRRCDPKTRFAVLIPARNEEAVIGHTVAQFLKQTYPESLYDLYIIPNNCTDGTAEAARRAGAKVMVCTVPVRTKGQVLKWPSSSWNLWPTMPTASLMRITWWIRISWPG